MRELKYTTESTDRGVICVTVSTEGKIFFELECLDDSPYTIEEEIQIYLDDNGYVDEMFDFINITK